MIEPGSSLAPFRYVVFREIWVANLVSNLGSMIQSVAAQWLMTDLTHSHRLIAMVSTSSTIGIMLFGVFAGAIADNFDRRRVMLAAQMGMLVASALLAALTYAGLITPYLLLAFTLAVGIGTALNSPAWQASVRQQVAIADLPQAISLNSISFNLARCVGPALGGLLISLWNVSLAFAINAVSFIAMIFVLLRWHPVHSPPPRRAMLPTIAAGIRYCAGAPDIRRILLRGFVMGVGLAGYQALVPAVVRGQLHGTEVQFGLLLGLFGIGSILSALIIGEMRRRFGNEAVITVSALAFVAAQTVLAAAHSLTAALPASFIAGGGWVAGLTTINVIMQLKSPDEIIGRCMSIYQAVTFGGMAMGAWLWGTVADWGGLSVALHAASAWLLVTVVILRFVAPMPEIQPGQRARASS
ncbi:MAG: MFS transporter [Novosphingobium sp.]|nr:MFS transporter [Novosphingobium sp.]